MQDLNESEALGDLECGETKKNGKFLKMEKNAAWRPDAWESSDMNAALMCIYAKLAEYVLYLA
jgi:hypothetical protein